MVNCPLWRYLNDLELLCQDLWVLTPHLLWPSFVIVFCGIFVFDFLEKAVYPGQQGQHVVTPVISYQIQQTRYIIRIYLSV